MQGKPSREDIRNTGPVDSKGLHVLYLGTGFFLPARAVSR